jgi:hypothetical protein
MQMVHGGLQHLSPQRRAVAAKALFLCRSIMRARQTSQATLFDGFKALVLQQSDMLLTVLHLEWLLASINRKPIYLVACCL